ncbi:hypothetical protein SAMN05444161_4318 [Rhizobiales bacterium GAS191]|nr:hypothetical protein SAMN05444161_4318 [Rhizobiales bacterium GAS191]
MVKIRFHTFPMRGGGVPFAAMQRPRPGDPGPADAHGRRFV